MNKLDYETVQFNQKQARDGKWTRKLLFMPSPTMFPSCGGLSLLDAYSLLLTKAENQHNTPASFVTIFFSIFSDTGTSGIIG